MHTWGEYVEDIPAKSMILRPSGDNGGFAAPVHLFLP
jgi:hypothetical protein